MSLGDNLIQEGVQTDSVLANVVHVEVGILAPLLADSSEVVIVGLDNEPVFII